MADEGVQSTSGTVTLPARVIPPPAGASEAARRALDLPHPLPASYPPLADKAAWRSLAAAGDAVIGGMLAGLADREDVPVAAHRLGTTPAVLATPSPEHRLSDRHVLLDIHGGALIYGGGEANVRLFARLTALRSGCVVYSVDYRMPPDHPYPAALDDCVAAYRALLELRPAHEIVVSGTSAGGNLAAALLLRARQEGLPPPAGAILLTPEVDLTESGDTFETLLGLDFLPRLIEVNRLYADGADLADPFLSPLFGDVSGFPPTFLQSGTRDIFLSNTVRLHRRLRSAGVRAELHVWEGMPHGGFGGDAPEDGEIDTEMRAFIASL